MARLIVLLTGDIDALNAETACRMLDAIDGPAEIDLSGVRYLASAGLTELARVAKRVGARVVTLKKCSPRYCGFSKSYALASYFCWTPLAARHGDQCGSADVLL